MLPTSPRFGRSELFEIPPEVTYLNAASMSPIPRSVREAGEEGVARKASPWKLSRSSFYDIVEDARVEASKLIGARPQDMAIIGSASYGIAVAARNLKLDGGKVILTLQDEHPSPVYAWARLAAENRLIHEEIARPADYDWTTSILARMNDSAKPPVGILSLTPLHWSDGSLIDLAAVRIVADKIGAALVVDGTQSVGARPFDLRHIRPDFLIFPTYKWLFGPYGLAFLYADAERQNGIPLEEHSWSRAGADLVSDHYERDFRFMEGARRYDMGERSNFVTLPMAIEGMKFVQRMGMEEIALHISQLTRRIEAGAAELGFSSPPTALRAGHIIGLRKKNCDANSLVSGLAGQGIYVSARNGAIRVAPHVYNDAADIERFLTALTALATLS